MGAPSSSIIHVYARYGNCRNQSSYLVQPSTLSWDLHFTPSCQRDYVDIRRGFGTGDRDENMQDIHLGRSSCLLCRQAPRTGTSILDLNQTLLVASECELPCGGCSYHPYPLVWFHATCYNILEASYKPSNKPSFEDLRRFADAVKPIYEPQQKEHGEVASTLEGVLGKYTRNVIQDSFRQDLFGQFPLEIKTIIAELIGPCWYLIVLGETRRLIERLRSDRRTQSTQLGLTREIWISKVRYRGVSYVASLSEKPLESECKSGQYRVKLPRIIKGIILSVDSIGLRAIQFTDRSPGPTANGSPWYEIIEPGDPHIETRVNYSGLFVRGLELISDDSSPTCKIWNTPFPPKFLPENVFHSRNNPRLEYLRFDAQLQGLIVCCCNGRNMGVHGFSNVSKEFEKFVDLMRQRARKSRMFWMYFPLNEREYVQSAWVRKLKYLSGQASSPILILQTSLGRTLTCGPQLPMRIIEHCEYHSLVKNGDGIIWGIFHDGLDPGCRDLSEFGVTCNDQEHSGIRQPLPTGTHYEPPEVPPRRGSIASSWYLTTAPLKGLVKVQVCRDRDQPHFPCLGFLMYYDDQLVESLGQVRWDYDLTQEISRPMYVESGIVDGQDFIKDIRGKECDPDLDGKRDGWQRIPECGTIGWWFGHLGDRIIIYNN